MARIYRTGAKPILGREAIHTEGYRVTISIEADPRDGLTAMEKAIVDSAGSVERKASDLAELAGYSCNNRFLDALRGLVRAGLLVKSGVDAYRVG